MWPEEKIVFWIFFGGKWLVYTWISVLFGLMCVLKTTLDISTVILGLASS